MNKKIIFILTLALAATLMISCVSAEGMFDFLSSANSDTANDDEKFVVGFNAAFPPFGYKDDNGSYIGFDLALAEEVANRNNWTFVAQPIIDWNTKEVELNSDVVDCIWSEFTINGRESDYTWSDPYFNTTQVFIVKNDSNISSVSDLKGKTVEIQEGSSALETLNTKNETLKDSFDKLIEIKEYDTGFMDLESGACDALIADAGVAHYHIAEKFGDGNYKILDEPLSYEQYGIGFKKGNTELRDQVQKTLDEMFEDGTIDRIAQDYSNYNIPEGIIHP
jgi:polar amino acid transport system substrate-binding protein